jgi:hypothetical protein
MNVWLHLRFFAFREDREQFHLGPQPQMVILGGKTERKARGPWSNDESLLNRNGPAVYLVADDDNDDNRGLL